MESLELLKYFDPGRENQFPSHPANLEEIGTAYRRYHGLMMTYCGEVTIPSPRGGYLIMWHEPISFALNPRQPFMEMSLTSSQIPLPEGWTRDNDTPLVIPDNVGIDFKVGLRKFTDMFPFKHVRYHLEPNRILWDMGTELLFSVNTPVNSADCEKLHLLADLFERSQSQLRLPGS